MVEALWTEREAAEYRRCSVSLIQKERITGKGCPFVKMGRSVRYRPEDVRAWVARKIITSTSAAA